MKLKKNLFLGVILTVFSFTVRAQGEIDDTEIIVEKDRSIQFSELQKDTEKIEFSLKDEKDRTYSYPIHPPRPFDLALFDIDIKALNLKLPKEEDPLSNHLRLGFGNYTTPYLEAHLGSLANEDFVYHVQLKHLSSQTGPVDGKNSANSDNIGKIYAKYFTGNLAVSGTLSYRRKAFYFYGYDPDLENVNRDSIKQIINHIHIGAGISNSNEDADLNYKIAADFDILSDHYRASENLFSIPLSASYRWREDQKVQVDLKGFFTQRKDSTSLSRTWATFNPSYEFNTDRFLIHIGGLIAYQNDTVYSSNTSFYPDVQVKYHLNQDFNVYAGLGGNVMQNTLLSLLQENPFLRQDIHLINSRKKMVFYGGIEGNILPALRLDASISYQNVDNLHFFVNNPIDSSQFDVIYLPENSKIVSLTGSLNYDDGEKLKASLRINYDNYTLDSINVAFHRPTFRSNLWAKYQITESLHIHTDVFYAGGINTVLNETEYHLNDIIDINLGIEYYFSDKFSAFLSGNNLISNNYQRYLFYPVRGINFLAGISYSF